MQQNKENGRVKKIDMDSSDSSPLKDEKRRSDSELATGSLENRAALNQFIPEKKRVLEVGCGNGHLSELILQKKNLLIGIDISQEAVFYCKQRFGDRATFIEANILSFDPAERFDFVFINDVLDQIQEDEKALQRIGRLLEKNGKLVLSTPIATERFIEASVHIYSEKSILEKLVRSGFHIEKKFFFGGTLAHWASVFSGRIHFPKWLLSFIRKLPFYRGLLAADSRLCLQKDRLVVIATVMQNA